MLRTRVGYAGGSTPDPTYDEIGDHTEAFQVDFVPEELTYSELLEHFWKSHRPCSRAWSRQYRNAVFYHSEDQRRLAEDSANRILREHGETVHTLIEPAGRFYLAEDYHQKYRLRGHTALVEPLLELYPARKDFVDSTAATRLNAYVAGQGRREEFERDLPRLGLSASHQELLRSLFR